MFYTELEQMQNCNQFLPVPVLADASLAGNRDQGGARESQVHVTDAAAVSDSQRRAKECSGEGRGSGSLFRMFQLPFASPDFMFAIQVLDRI